jgi:hypothetical protein
MFRRKVGPIPKRAQQNLLCLCASWHQVTTLGDNDCVSLFPPEVTSSARVVEICRLRFKHGAPGKDVTLFYIGSTGNAIPRISPENWRHGSQFRPTKARFASCEELLLFFPTVGEEEEHRRRSPNRGYHPHKRASVGSFRPAWLHAALRLLQNQWTSQLPLLDCKSCCSTPWLQIGRIGRPNRLYVFLEAIRRPKATRPYQAVPPVPNASPGEFLGHLPIPWHSPPNLVTVQPDSLNRLISSSA